MGIARKILFVLLLVLAISPQALLAKKTLSDANSALQDVIAPSGLAENDDVETAAADVVAWIMQAMGLLFFILMVYAGVVWMTAKGEEDRVTKARETIIAATIGLVITISAYAITRVVSERIIAGNTGGNGGFGQTDDESGGGANNLGCCIMPVDIYSIESAIPSVTNAAGCQEKAYEIWGKPGEWDAVDTANQKGNDWDFYPETSYPGAASSVGCAKIAGCWVGAVGKSSEASCIDEALSTQ